MTSIQEARVKLTNTQLSKLKSETKNNIGAILRINNKNVQDEELPHKLFLTIGQTTKIKIVFSNSMSADIKFSQGQISKIIHSGRFLRNMLGNVGKK